MLSRPCVSAIIPTYNRAALLNETLRSLMAQTVRPDEVIVVDDGSEDETASVVAQFFPCVRYIRIANSGAPVARNVGASQAIGDWLWFCDSDDLWHPTYLARVLDLAAAQPSLAFIFGNFQLVHDGKWGGPSKFATAPAGYWDGLGVKRVGGGAVVTQPLYSRLLRFQPVFHSTLLVSRMLFHRIGGYEHRFAGVGSEDFEFVLRCAVHAPAGMIEDPLVGIRRHPGNYSAGQLRNLLGEISILRYAQVCHDRAAQSARAIIDEQIALRTGQALDIAFARRHFDLVRSLAQSLARRRLTLRQRLKIALASLPRGVRYPAIGIAERCRGLAMGRLS